MILQTTKKPAIYFQLNKTVQKQTLLSFEGGIVTSENKHCYITRPRLFKSISLKVASDQIHKAKETIFLENYMPVSIVPVVSKLFGRNMLDQMSSYIKNFLNPYLIGYRKGHSAERVIAQKGS